MTMNPDWLLNHFNEISEAPDAVLRLRRFILDLAVRGKLVQQDPKDEPASGLLRRIVAEKDQLEKDGTIRKAMPLSSVEGINTPFEIPSGWKWTRLGESVIDHKGGGTPSKGNSDYCDGEIFWASVKDIGKTKYVDQTIDRITKAGLENSSSNLIPPGNLIVVTRMGLGKVSINRVPIAINQDLRALFISDLSAIDFYYIFFRTASYEGTGLTVKGIKIEELLNFPFPFPPLAEQHRIVAKVDELMALCNELEAAQQRRERRRDRLVAATLNGLNNGDASSETHERPRFEVRAHFYFNHLPRLTARPEHIQQLRQTILNLAVRGKLIPQDPNDEPVSAPLALCDRMREEIAKEDCRADTGIQTLLAAEDKWEVPYSWEWRALADLVLFIDYRGQTPSKVEQGVKLITAKNVKKGVINLSPEEFLSESNYHTWMTRGFPKVGDVLFTTEAPMGNAAVVRLPEPFALAQRVICFRPYGAVNPDFLVFQILAEPFQAILYKTATGLTAKGIKAAKLKRLPVVVPPPTEQHRIVAKVEELMALCDEMESRLSTTAATRRQLLEATLSGAMAQ